MPDNVSSDAESEIAEKSQTPEIKVPESIVELKKKNTKEDQLDEPVTGHG